MYAMIFQVLTVLAGGRPGRRAGEHNFSRNSSNKAWRCPTGRSSPCPLRLMAEGLTAAQQIRGVDQDRRPEQDPPAAVSRIKNAAAPVSLKLKKLPAKIGGDVIRVVNLHFVVYGDWDVLTGEKFSKTILKAGKANNGNGGSGQCHQGRLLEGHRI